MASSRKSQFEVRAPKSSSDSRNAIAIAPTMYAALMVCVAGGRTSLLRAILGGEFTAGQSASWPGWISRGVSQLLELLTGPLVFARLEPPRKKKRSNWIWSVAPSNAGTNGFGTLLPLFVTQLGGNVIDYSIMSTLYNISVTVSQGLWGIATDRLARRRLFFVLAFVGMTVVFISMYIFPTLLWLTIGYGILGLVITANVTAASLLVMETSEKKSWVSLFSMLALVSNLGAIVGLLAGIF